MARVDAVARTRAVSARTGVFFSMNPVYPDAPRLVLRRSRVGERLDLQFRPVLPIEQVRHPASTEAAEHRDQPRLEASAAESLMKPCHQRNFQRDLSQLAAIQLVRMTIKDKRR